VRFSELEGRRVGVWGLGREGLSVARAIAARLPGTPLVLVDESRPPGAGERWEGLPVVSELAALADCEVVVRSPGVSLHRPEVATLRAAGVTVTSGTRLWFAEHPDARAIGVTGTKGKSTTSALIAHLAAARGLRVQLAGNIGRPLADLLASPARTEADLWVLELSSFQTADLDASPSVGVLLNLYREHTDWHGTQERYWDDKLNLFGHRAEMISVLNRADPRIRERTAAFPHPRWFRSPDGFDTTPEGVTRGGRLYAPREVIRLAGEHNLDNVCAAFAALEAVGIEGDDLVEALPAFRPLAHRLEPVLERDGILFVNDSIATIPEASVAAARALASRPTVLLVGGRDRRQDYAALADYLAGPTSVVGVVGLPGNGPEILARLAESASEVPTEPAADMEDAVRRAVRMIPRGGVVLLSPGAPSGDDFGDFQVRGEAFRSAVAGN
jgi:UDP-N-acetylmuramoyl-L-alanine---L-glutamate ligase